jgi:hypothetical protein
MVSGSSGNDDSNMRI